MTRAGLRQAAVLWLWLLTAFLIGAWVREMWWPAVPMWARYEMDGGVVCMVYRGTALSCLYWPSSAPLPPLTDPRP